MTQQSSERAPVPPAPAPIRLPQTPVANLMRPFVRFLQIESASGIALLLGAVVALVLANSPWADSYASFWKTPVRVGVGAWLVEDSLLHLVNDGLMTIFFFVVGLEIKRELVAGELRDPRKAALPVMAALGGMVAPAAIYWGLVHDQPGATGWAIPMATDIAFVVGFLAVLGKRVPFGLKILLLSLAIADDIGAILVIACFYSTNISFAALGLAAVGILVCFLFNRIGVRRVPVYVIVGAGIWAAFLQSGVHPTVAGVLLGLLTPASAWIGNQGITDLLDNALARLSGDVDGRVEHHHRLMLGQLQFAVGEAISPLERLEIALHPWVAFGIMPLFALANAGVVIDPAAFNQPVGRAVAIGLVLGKPLGIVLFSWLAVSVGLAKLPSGVNWFTMVGAGCLAGIGFTMSLFIAALALPPDLLAAGKIGTMSGSTISAVVGLVLLLTFLPRRKEPTDAGKSQPH